MAKALLRELIVRAKMDEAHASGFLVSNGFAHRSGALNGLEYHTTNIVSHDFVGQYSIKPQFLQALETALEEEENE